MQTRLMPEVDAPAIRQSGADVLSLALMDARNHTLHLIGQFGPRLGALNPTQQPTDHASPPLWTLGHIGWFQERWVARHVQRHEGRLSDPNAPLAPSIEPYADVWWNPAQQTPRQRWALALPEVGAVKAYLLDTLETTLALLEKSAQDDAALYFFRLALFHEDQQGEALVTQAQAMGLALGLGLPGPMPVQAALCLPATRWALGVADTAAGFSFDNERPAYEVQVPAFDMDAQVVTWAQFVEFVGDGGYDRPELWQPEGWAWVQEGHRAPRYVEQIGVASGAVLQTRFGTPRRMLGGQAATHLSWWEADAWCRWAGRRLPSEVEWEVAAHSVMRHQFRWGDVWEWTSTPFRAYPGFVADPDARYSSPHFGTHKVLRGASFATRARMKNPKYRHFARPEQDELFVGFRSCSL